MLYIFTIWSNAIKLMEMKMFDYSMYNLKFLTYFVIYFIFIPHQTKKNEKK